MTQARPSKHFPVHRRIEELMTVLAGTNSVARGFGPPQRALLANTAQAAVPHAKVRLRIPIEHRLL